MALTKANAQEIVDIVARDANCANRINSIFGNLPAKFKTSGEIRNLLIITVFDIIPDNLDKWGIKKRTTYQSNEFARHCCVGINDAVCALFEYRHKLPYVKQIIGGSCVTTDHYAPVFEMESGGKYVFDWWMSLDVNNPILWCKSDWDHFTNPAHFFKGVPLREFQGFDDPKLWVPKGGRIPGS